MVLRKILYVEDNIDTAQAVQSILKNAGYDAHLAHTGSDGLQKLQSYPFDLVMLDVMLPDMSGWDVFQRIKCEGHKCIFMSAIPASQERIEQIKRDGIRDYILKPFSKEDLLSRIDRAIKDL